MEEHREDLADFISTVTRDETPFMSSISEEEATSIYHEYYTDIGGKSIAVSGTTRAVDQAGVADEYAYQLKKHGVEIRRDIGDIMRLNRKNRRALLSKTSSRAERIMYRVHKWRV